MIDIEKEYFIEIKHILNRIVPNCEVRIFVSRVNGKASKYSDIDLVVISNDRLDFHTIEKLKDAFSESNLPIIVDVLDWNRISDKFKKIIEKRYEIIKKPRL